MLKSHWLNSSSVIPGLVAALAAGVSRLYWGSRRPLRYDRRRCAVRVLVIFEPFHSGHVLIPMALLPLLGVISPSELPLPMDHP